MGASAKAPAALFPVQNRLSERYEQLAMAPQRIDDDDDDRYDSYDDLGDLEYPDESDDHDDEAALVDCPECGGAIYEEAEQCPLCGAYVTHRSSLWTGRSLWWIVLGVLGIAAVILVLALGRF